MPNPFHDETGRFCSKEEMKGIVDSLGEAVAKQRTADSALVDRWIEMKGAYAAAEKQAAAEDRADFAAPAKKAPMRIQHEALSELMEFGRIVRSDGSGVVNEQPYDHSQYVDEIQYVYSEEDGSTDEPDVPAGWEYLRGFTGQYGYNGPVMHESEYMGGALAEHIIDNPGTYVTVAIEALPVDLDGNEEAEPVGWAVLRRLEAKPVVSAAEREKRRGSAKELMEFGRVIQVGKEGVPFPALNGLGLSTPPEEIQYVAMNLEDDTSGEPNAPEGWEYLTGFSGQHGYTGPVMHEGEDIGGSLADHILDNPGFYVAVSIYGQPTDPEDTWVEPIGWGVLRKVD